MISLADLSKKVNYYFIGQKLGVIISGDEREVFFEGGKVMNN